MTAYFEAGTIVGATSDDSRVFADLIDRDEAGGLPVRVAGSYWTRTPTDDPQTIAEGLTRWHRELRSEHVQIGTCVVGGRDVHERQGAALLSPCCGHAADDLGTMTFPPEAITAQIEAVQAAGFDMHTSTSTATVRRGWCWTPTPPRGRRPVVRAVGMCWRTTRWWTRPMSTGTRSSASSPTAPRCGDRLQRPVPRHHTAMLGAERWRNGCSPYGDLVRSGATVTYGSDIPGVDIPEIPPLIQIEALLTRQRPGIPTTSRWWPASASGCTTLRGYTANGAYQLRLDHRTGTLTTGKAADLTVLGADLFRVAPHEIHAVPVVLTMMDGRITHDAR